MVRDRGLEALLEFSGAGDHGSDEARRALHEGEINDCLLEQSIYRINLLLLVQVGRGLWSRVLQVGFQSPIPHCQALRRDIMY